MKLYVASSWRNARYSSVIGFLRYYGHDVWDWLRPPTGGNGFSWADVGHDKTEKCSTADLKVIHKHPAAQAGFASDMAGLFWCDACVLLLPSGKSAHLEAGYCKGTRKPLYLLRIDDDEPDLMHLMCDEIFDSMEALRLALIR